MNILALDTSMGLCSAAVLQAGGPARSHFVREAAMERGHAEALMPMIEEVLRDARLSAGDLEMIAATIGPGSFTGVRIAIAAARGLALVCGAKLFGADSLSVMARAAQRHGFQPEAPFAVAVDARRGMLYLGLFDSAGKLTSGPALYTLDEAAMHLPDELHLAVGSGAGLLAEAAMAQDREVRADLPALQPGAPALAELAHAELSDAKFAADGLDRSTTELLRPLYLRPPDAKPQGPALERR